MTGKELKAMLPDDATVWITVPGEDDAVELTAEDVDTDKDGDVVILAPEGEESEEAEPEEEDEEDGEENE